MLFSRNWLADYVDLPPDSELADRLTFAGLAVEGREPHGEDLVLDLDVTTNRPDAMCHFGLARELAVLTGRPLRRPDAELDETDEATSDAVAVTLEDPEGCLRYVARIVRGVTVEDSPDWLRERLQVLGMRPINNVVDVTNYVLWETGQPLHGFDLAKLGGAEIRVRRARAGETLTTLDEEERELTPEMLVIADATEPVALAGVMGGLDSEVGADTRDVLIESAHFDPKAVRRTAKLLGMHTDASHRFERGADPGACRWAADRAARLLTEVAGGEVLAGAVDARAELPEPRRGRLELARLRAFAGFPLEADEVERILGGLGFGLEAVDGEAAWELTVPSWRHYDFEPRRDRPEEIYPADAYEEVLRIVGFDRLPATLPGLEGSDGPVSPQQRRRDRIRDHLAACGYAEAINFAFHSTEDDRLFPSLRPDAAPVTLANPLSERYDTLRRSLLPNLVANARFNRRRGAEAVGLFEIGHLFFATGDAGPGSRDRHDTGVDELEAVALVLGGSRGTPWDRPRQYDFFDLKGAVESLGEILGVEVETRPAELPGLVPGTTATLHVAGGRLGHMGRLAEEEAEFPVFVAELITDALAAPAGAEDLTVEVPSRFPGIAADLTLTHSLEVAWAELAAAVEELRPADLVDFGLKDRYQGEGVPAGAVNTTLYFVYNAPDRSLTQEEVNDRQRQLAAALEERCGWQEGES